MIQPFFFLGTFSVPPINFNSLGESLYQHQLFDDHNSVHLKKTGTQDVYAYDHALKFSILQENPSLKQTETPN